MVIFSISKVLLKNADQHKFSQNIVMASGFCVDPRAKLKNLAKPLKILSHSPPESKKTKLNQSYRKRKMQDVVLKDGNVIEYI